MTSKTRVRSPVPGDRFRAAVARAGRTIPHVSQQLIEKYLADLDRVGLLSPGSKRR
ncbi:hypothetical protein [Mycobacterium mantenii]|uniref:hypothetical protein n=1 Tax=Mycobacterium mantenii TaxID=560555 RepID=UPI0013F4F2D7|nr:hypothetical protein [Mycobacterium mantenii]